MCRIQYGMRSIKKYWDKAFPKEIKDPNDYVLVPIPMARVFWDSLKLFLCSTFVYLFVVAVCFSMGTDPEIKKVGGISALVLGLPIYVLFCIEAYRTWKTRYVETLSPEAEKRKSEKEKLRKEEDRRISQEDFEVIYNAPWYFRYPIALTITALLLWFISSGEESVGLWLAVGLWGVIAVMLMRELALVGIAAVIAFWVFKGIAELPVSVAIIIGAVVIANAMRNK